MKPRNGLKMAWHFCVPQKSSTMKHHRIYPFLFERWQDVSPFLTQWDLRRVGSSLRDVLVSLMFGRVKGWWCSSKKAFGPLQYRGWRSVTSSTSILSVDPVQCDKCQAHAHKDEAQSSKAGRLKHKRNKMTTSGRIEHYTNWHTHLPAVCTVAKVFNPQRPKLNYKLGWLVIYQIDV